MNQERLSNVVARLNDGAMTIVFKDSDCDSLVVKEVRDRSAFVQFHKILNDIWMGVGVMNRGGRGKLSVPPLGHRGEGSPDPVSGSGKRKAQLNLSKR